MKRSWLGLGLLLVLLALSVAVTCFMTRIHEDMALELRQSAKCALLGDWDNAQLFLERANRSWERWNHLRTCFADHSPVEAIDASLASLEVYCRSRESLAYRAACAALEKQITALGEAHAMTWWNVF